MSTLPQPSLRAIFFFVFFGSILSPFLASSQKVGINTTSPQSGLEIIHDDGMKVTGDFGDGGVHADSTGTMMLFSPRTGSFRVGRLTNEDSGAYEGWWSLFNTGDYSFVSGLNTRATAYASFASGHKNQATGLTSFVAGGHANIASGHRSFAAGVENTAPSYGEFVIGTNALTYTPAGITGYVPSDRLFVVGNGANSSSRSNALTILKNGNLGIGTTSPSAPLHVAGSSIIDNGKLIFLNTGNSVFIGDGAGTNDDLSTNQNIFIGNNSGENNTTGESNVAVGVESAANNTSGIRNVAIGHQALSLGSTVSDNVAIGYASLINATGPNNTAIGTKSGFQNVDGYGNTFLGAYAGEFNNGHDNVFIGKFAGQNETGDEKLYVDNSNTSTPLIYGDFINNRVIINDILESKQLVMTLGAGQNKILQSDAGGNGTWVDPTTVFSDDWNSSGNNIYNSNLHNVGIGTSSPTEKLQVVGNLKVTNGRIDISNGGLSTMIGVGAGANDIVANSTACTYVGYGTGANSTTGGENTGMGAFALNQNVNGNFNVAFGNGVMDSNTSGSYNTGLGYQALASNFTGLNNVAVGMWSLLNATGNSNVSVGTEAGFSITSGNNNTFLGYQAGRHNDGNFNVFIGNNAGMNITGDNKLAIDNSNSSTPLIFGNFATNKVTVNDSLESKYFGMTNGASNGHLLVSNANGQGTWTAPSLVFSDDWNSSNGNIYNANTLNVGIGTSTPTAPLHVIGNVRFHNARLSFTGTGQSVFIGEDAGQNDDLSSNNSVFIGYQAGKSNKSGNDNIAIGANALDDAATSHYNIAIGESSMTDANMDGDINIGLGNFTLVNNETGSNNIAIGQNAMDQNVSGSRNTALGHASLDANSSGSWNVAIGDESLGSLTNNDFNVGVGYYALGNNVSGTHNVAVGANAGLLNTGSGNLFLGNEAGFNETGSNKLHISNTGVGDPLIYGDFSIKKIIINDSLSAKYFQMTNGATNNHVLKSDNTGKGTWTEPSLLFHDISSNNLFIGDEVGQSVTTATDNTIVGAYAGGALTSGYENTGLGLWALQDLTTATFNTAIGHNTLSNNQTGNKNTALGWSALAGATGASNVALGGEAGGENNAGSRNVYVGTESGTNNTGSDNVFIGYQSGKNESGSNKLFIENSSSSTPLLYGDFSTNEITINDSLTVSKELSVGTSTANSTLEVNGSVAAKFKTPLTAGTNNPDGTGMVWRYSAGTGTITLPAASTCPNRMYVIINQTGSTRNISSFRDLTTTPQTTLGSSVALWLMSDGNEWWQIK